MAIAAAFIKELLDLCAEKVRRSAEMPLRRPEKFDLIKFRIETNIDAGCSSARKKMAEKRRDAEDVKKHGDFYTDFAN